MITINLENILEPVHLGEFPLEEGDSKAFEFLLKIAGAAEDMTGWTCRLYAGDTPTLLKTITEASDEDAQGQIDTPASGEFFFTIDRDDLDAFEMTGITVKVPCFIQFDTGESAPPRVFSCARLALVIRA